MQSFRSTFRKIRLKNKRTKLTIIIQWKFKWRVLFFEMLFEAYIRSISKILLIEILFKKRTSRETSALGRLQTNYKTIYKILQSIFNFTDRTDARKFWQCRVSTVHIKLHVPGSVCFPTCHRRTAHAYNRANLFPITDAIVLFAFITSLWDKLTPPSSFFQPRIPFSNGI